MSKLIQMQVSEELYADLAEKAKVLDQSVAAYCRTTLAGLVRGVSSAVIVPAPKQEPTTLVKKVDDKADWLKQEKLLEKERKMYGGRTIDDWVNYFSGPYEELSEEHAGTAEGNLPFYLERKARKDKVPLEELQEKYKAQKPRAKQVASKPPREQTLDEILESLNYEEGEE